MGQLKKKQVTHFVNVTVEQKIINFHALYTKIILTKHAT